MEEIEWNESSRRKRNSIIFPIVKELILVIFKVDGRGSQIAVIFRSLWLHLKEWYDSLFWNVNIFSTPVQQFSKGGSWARSIWIPWELDRFSGLAPEPQNWGLWERVLTCAPGDLMHTCVWEPRHPKWPSLQLPTLTVNIFSCQFKICEGTQGLTKNVWGPQTKMFENCPLDPAPLSIFKLMKSFLLRRG